MPLPRRRSHFFPNGQMGQEDFYLGDGHSGRVALLMEKMYSRIQLRQDCSVR